MPAIPNDESTGPFTTELGGQQVQVRSQPGFADWHTVTPAMRLVADWLELGADSRLLAWGTAHAAVVASLLLNNPTASATVPTTNIVARDAIEATTARAGLADRVTVLNYPRSTPEPAAFDTAVLLPTRQRDLNRRFLLETLAAVRPGGRVVVCGPNAGGIRSTLADAVGVFGDATEEIGQRKQRLAAFRRPECEPALPEWASTPGIAPGTWATFRVSLNGVMTELVTLPGVFSDDALDAGTDLLLQHLPEVSGRSVLDVGCGSGVIGLSAAGRGASDVTMTDVDLLAVAAARENIRRLDVPTVSAVASDLYRAINDRTFDVVLSNPPFHSGSDVSPEVARRLITGAPAVLTAGGELVVVANQFLPYDREMKQTFGDVDLVAESGRFRVLRSRLAIPDVSEPVDVPEPFAITDEMRRRFPIIDDPEKPKRKAQTRQRSSRSIRRGPSRRKH